MTVELYRAFRNITEQERLDKLNDQTLGKDYFKKIESVDDAISKIKAQNSIPSINTKKIDPAVNDNNLFAYRMTEKLFRPFRNSI